MSISCLLQCLNAQASPEMPDTYALCCMLTDMHYVSVHVNVIHALFACVLDQFVIAVS